MTEFLNQFSFQRFSFVSQDTERSAKDAFIEDDPERVLDDVLLLPPFIVRLSERLSRERPERFLSNVPLDAGKFVNLDTDIMEAMGEFMVTHGFEMISLN